MVILDIRLCVPIQACLNQMKLDVIQAKTEQNKKKN